MILAVVKQVNQFEGSPEKKSSKKLKPIDSKIQKLLQHI